MANVSMNTKKKIVVEDASSKITTLYAADLGNGFTKRTFDGSEVIIEPSVFAEVPRLNNSARHYYSLDKKAFYFVGQDVFDANLVPDVAVNDCDRYFSDEYKLMLFSFIASDFLEYDEIEIPVFVLGVPNVDHKAVREKMEEFYTGRTIITVDGSKQITINIESCIVVPQPLGTYAYGLSKGIIKEWGDSVLICDAGSGSFDVASITGDIIKKDEGVRIGALNAYRDIRKHLIDQFGESTTLTLENMPNILAEGLKKDGTAKIINDDPIVIGILDKNFKDMYKAIQKWGFDFDEHSKTLWTGGTSLLHKERIEAKEKETFVVLEEAQEANVRGFYEIAKDLAMEGGFDGDEEVSDVRES
jgi:hypothetical protein